MSKHQLSGTYKNMCCTVHCIPFSLATHKVILDLFLFFLVVLQEKHWLRCPELQICGVYVNEETFNK